MRWVSLKNLKPNRVLAEHILDERGRVLLACGVTITPGMISRLWKLGIGSVCIEDETTDDVNPYSFVRQATRQRILQCTYESLNDLVSTDHGRLVRSAKVKSRLKPLLIDTIQEIRDIDGAGEHLGSVYLSDGELYHHSVNVTFFSLSLGLAMGMDDDNLIELGIGTLLHDVGKLRIPDVILRKPGRLTPEEFETVKLHASYGFEILGRVSDLPVASVRVALQHHEKYDGTGYPQGLKRQEIHLFGRIACVADVYEALTANRVYRTGYLPHQAYELLLGAGGTQFDPAVVDKFVNTIAVYPSGATLLLSNGYRAVVLSSARRQTHRPLVRIIEDASGNPVQQPWQLDLLTERTTEIVGCET